MGRKRRRLGGAAWGCLRVWYDGRSCTVNRRAVEGEHETCTESYWARRLPLREDAELELEDLKQGTARRTP
jgi:hypothetical protein